jgi:hypothetical protein
MRVGNNVSLRLLQRGLQDIYALQVAHSVDDFLLTNRELALQLGGAAALRSVRESLLVHEDCGELNLSLYLDPGVVDAFDPGRPAPDLAGAGLDDFCLAMEGVSHFLYLVWYASHDRSVTLLEMELQAEIDKFVMLRGVLTGAAGGSADGALQRLFENATFHADLSTEELARYQDANRLAERYCRGLERRYFRGGSRAELLRELRGFYRRSRSDKLYHIKRLDSAVRMV